MGIEFRNVRYPPFDDLSITAPDGAVIGLVGEKSSGDCAVLRLAAGLDAPVSGEVIPSGPSRYLAVTDTLNLAPVRLLLIDHAFAQADALVRGRALVALDRLRTNGTTVLLASHEPDLLRAICDEVWWFDAGKLAARGDPREVLDKYSAHISRKFRTWGEALSIPMAPQFRRGDGRAEIVALQLTGAGGQASAVVSCGETVTVRAEIRFVEAVANPVVGIMIRTRIGMEVYGTNTELERVQVGPCAVGETIRIDFTFVCDLCPKEYTLTAASHDPDGAAHHWIDDAVSFVVTDSRYTAGVANLRARVAVEKVH
jgi:lipopolysaccharide transport system ATP-binding protein